jgi:Ni,Fe-hydrogenase I small subunit
VGLELNVVNDAADLLVGDAVRALTGIGRANAWADDLGGVGPFLPSPNPFPNGFITLHGLSTVSAGAGDLIVTAIKYASSGPFVLLLDGAIPGSTGFHQRYTTDTQPGGPVWTEKYCLAFDNADHTGAPLIPWIATGANVTIADALRFLFNTGNCLACVCVGTCSSYGGIPGARGNKTGAKGLWTVGHTSPHPFSWLAYNQNLMYGVDPNRYIWTLPPVINVPGCPPHPDWVVYPVAHLLIHGTPPTLDSYDKRPRATFGDNGVFCDNCPNSFTQGQAPVPGDEDTPAYTLGDSGCLATLGCKGNLTTGDCPLRMKNTMDDGTKPNWCVGNDRSGVMQPGGPSIGHARHPCQGCIMPQFPDDMTINRPGRSFYEA